MEKIREMMRLRYNLISRGNQIRFKSSAESRIKELGIVIPDKPPAPKGSYTGYIKHGNLVYLAGHLPQPVVGKLYSGRLGENMTIEQGQEAAKLCGIQLLATLKAATNGDLDKVKKIIKLTGFINSTNDFTSQHLVLNGCSNFFYEVFGNEIGQHARSAIGTNTLPLDVPIEIEAIVEIKKERMKKKM